MKYILLFILFLPVNVKAQTIITFAGNGSTSDLGDGGPATATGIFLPGFGVFDKSQNYFLAEANGNIVRKISNSGIVSTIAGTGSGGFGGDGGPATLALLKNIQGIAIDTVGNIFISDNNNARIRKIDCITGIITTIAGNGTIGYIGDGIAATNAALDNPNGLCFDKKGNLFIADYGNSRIRKVGVDGIISTFAGTGINGFNGDGGLADTSEIRGAFYICSDDTGNIYIADEANGRVRKVDTFGFIHTIAGTGIVGESGDGFDATLAEIEPHCVNYDKFGNLYISDYYANVVRKVNSLGIVSTVAGNGVLGYRGDGGPATAAEFHDACGVATDSCGNLYICDLSNYRIRKVLFDSSCSIFSDISLKFASNYYKNEISIFPNPSNDYFFVQSSNAIKKIFIFNLAGQTLVTQYVDSKNASINVSNLPPGIYIVRVTDEEGNVVVRKVLKE